MKKEIFIKAIQLDARIGELEQCDDLLSENDAIICIKIFNQNIDPCEIKVDFHDEEDAYKIRSMLDTLLKKYQQEFKDLK